MPGSKRKIDEDTWLVLQSKKLKCSQIISNVYETTLAKLRLGARKSFASNSLAQSSGPLINLQGLKIEESEPINFALNESLNPTLAQVKIEPEVICQCCSTIGVNKFIPTQHQLPGDDCICYYCEKLACHVEKCWKCMNTFCVNCCLQRYENPYTEAFVCINCLK